MPIPKNTGNHNSQRSFSAIRLFLMLSMIGFSIQIMTNTPTPNWKAAILMCCPACGKRGVFKDPVKVRDNCSRCGTPLSHYETADGPAFFAITIVGLIVGLGAGLMEAVSSPPLWVQITIWLPFIFIGSLLIIRVTKTLMI